MSGWVAINNDKVSIHSLVGLNLKGISDSGSEAWQASSIMTASNSESFLVGSRHTASIKAFEPAPDRVVTTTLQFPNSCDLRNARPTILRLFLRVCC